MQLISSLRKVAGFAVIMLASLPVFAKTFSLTPLVSVEQILTDNLSLQPDANEDFASVTLVRPGVGLLVDGRYTQITGNYQFDYYHFALTPRQDTRYQSGELFFQRELLDKLFYIDAGANYRQAAVTDTGVQSGNLYSVPQNIEDLLTARIEPYIQTTFTNDISLRTGVSASEVQYIGSSAFDSTIQTMNASLNNQRANNRFSFSADFNRVNVVTQSGLNSGFADINLSSGFAFWRPLRLMAELGQAAYISSDDLGIIGGSIDKYAGVRLAYAPDNRLSAQAGYQQRAYGEAVNIDVAYRIAQLSFSASYNTQIESNALRQANALTSQPDPQQMFSNALSQAQLQTDFSLTKTMRASGMYNFGRASVSVGVDQSRRESQNGAVLLTRQALASGQRNLSRSMSIQFRSQLTQTTPTGGSRFWAADMGVDLNKTWSRSVTTLFGYQYQQRLDRLNPTTDYVANILRARINASF